MVFVFISIFAFVEKETLYIENFGPIRKAELDLKQAIVLIGPQSSGKSAIAKLISILRDFRFVNQQETFENLLENFNALSFLSLKTTIKYISKSHGFKFESGKGEIIFDLQHKYFQAKKKFEEFEAANPGPEAAEQLKELEKKYEGLKISLNDFSELSKEKQLELLTTIGQTVNELLLVSQRAANKKEMNLALLQFTNYSVYVPAERLLIAIYSASPLSFINSNLPIPKNILEFGAEFEKARQSINKYKIPFLNFRYSFESGADMVYYNQSEGTKLKESSTGLQTLIPLLLVIANKWIEEHVLYSYVVEEPEQNLYPLTQQKLVYHLSERCIRYNEQKTNRSDLVVTTHSPYILTSFNNLLFADLVAKKTGNEEGVSKIIPLDSRISPDDFNAYFVSEGGVKPIFNRETGLIDDNELDSASEEIMSDFNLLMDIYKEA